jgi:hypothetical protein
MPVASGRANARRTMRSSSAGSAPSKNMPANNCRIVVPYPMACMRSRIVCSAATGSPVPTRLPSTNTTPATRAGHSRKAWRTTRHPVLCPTRKAGAKRSAPRRALTSAPYVSMLQSAGTPSEALWPRRSHVTTHRHVRKESCKAQEVRPGYAARSYT